MSAPNFKPMEYNMPMVCGGMNYWEQKEAYEKEYEEEYTPEMFYMDTEEEFNEAQAMAENFTGNLKFHDVTVIGGYYEGFQFWVEEKYSGYFDLDKGSRYCIDNEDARYYFDMYRSQALRAAESEKRKIERWLESLNGHGFEILVCTGRFSDGSATYGNRNNVRARLKAACIA